MTPDHNPILGFVEEGLLVAAGFSGHGVQQAAMVGRLMAEEVAFGQAQSLDLTPFRLRRFWEGKPLRERGIVSGLASAGGPRQTGLGEAPRANGETIDQRPGLPYDGGCLAPGGVAQVVRAHDS